VQRRPDPRSPYACISIGLSRSSLIERLILQSALEIEKSKCIGRRGDETRTKVTEFSARTRREGYDRQSLNEVD
jgi:hypothetical protein